MDCEPEILRDYLVELLRGKPEFSACQVLSRKTADLQNEIERNLAKEGLLALVILPELTPKPRQSATVLFDPAEIRVRVTENVTLNRARSGPSALAVSCRVLSYLQMCKPPFEWCGVLVPTGLRELNILSASPDEDEEEDYCAWDCIFRTQITIQPRPET